MITPEEIHDIFYNAREEAGCCDRCKWDFKERVERFIKEHGSEGVKALVALVGEKKEEDGDICAVIVWALAETEDAETLAERTSANRAFMKAKTPWVREAAISGTEGVGDRDCENELRELIQNEDDSLTRGWGEQILNGIIKEKEGR